MSAAITGLGIIAPTGNTAEDYWEATLAGENGIGAVTRFDASGYPSNLAGEIRNFDARNLIPSKLMPQTDNMTRYALYAADQAVRDSQVKLTDLDPYELGVFTSASGGAVEFGQRELQNLWAKGKEYVSAYQSFAWFYAVNTGQISIKNQTKGPSGVILSEQSGGLDAIAWADRKISRGLKFALCGGVDSALSPWGYVPQIASGRMTTAQEPATAYQPFGTESSGYVTGEGGAMLALTPLSSSYKPHNSYGRISGHSSTFGEGEPALTACIKQALKRAELSPTHIDVLFADASGIGIEDLAEADAIMRVFGTHGPPVTMPKTSTGRLLAGAGALDAATACLALKNQTIPPSRCDYELAAPFTVVTQPTPADLGHAMIISRGFGGFNSVLIISNS